MNEKELLKAIGNRIKSLRKSQGLSQEALSELADLHPTYIGEIERATVNASIVNFYKIAKALKLTLPEVLIVPSKKENEKDLILHRIIALLRKQNLNTLRSIEKSINVFIEFTKR